MVRPGPIQSLKGMILSQIRKPWNILAIEVFSSNPAYMLTSVAPMRSVHGDMNRHTQA